MEWTSTDHDDEDEKEEEVNSRFAITTWNSLVCDSTGQTTENKIKWNNEGSRGFVCLCPIWILVRLLLLFIMIIFIFFMCSSSFYSVCSMFDVRWSVVSPDLRIFLFVVRSPFRRNKQTEYEKISLLLQPTWFNLRILNTHEISFPKKKNQNRTEILTTTTFEHSKRDENIQTKRFCVDFFSFPMAHEHHRYFYSELTDQLS